VLRSHRLLAAGGSGRLVRHIPAAAIVKMVNARQR